MSTPVLDAQKISPVRTFANDIAQVRSNNQKKPAGKVATTKLKTAPRPKFVSPPPVAKIPAAVSKPQPSAETIIPPFHTFSKSVVKPTAAVPVALIDTTEVTGMGKTVQKSTLTAPSHGVTVGDAADTDASATVITDTKHKRFSLTDALAGGVTTWYQTKKDELTGKTKPKYTVPEADRRKGVIQKATSQTGRMSTADHAEVLQRLRTARYQSRTATPTPSVTTAPPTQPVWETDQTGIQTPTPLSAAKPVQKINPVAHVETQTVPVAKREIVTEITPTQPILAHDIIQEEASVVSPIAPVQPRTRKKITPTLPVSERQFVPAELPVELPASLVYQPKEVSSLPEEVTVPSTQTQSVNVTRTATARLGIRVPRSVYIVTAGVVVLGSIGSLYFILRPGSESTPITSTRTITAETDTVSAPMPTAILVTSQEDIITALTNQSSEDVSLLEVTLLSTATGAPLSPTEFFTAFNVDLPLSFVSAINQIRVGVYRGAPWILLVVSDTPTGQGGMFAWEQTIMNDLRPWFANGVGYGNTTEKNSFTDSIIDARDVRLQKDTRSDYQILYGFINTNEILITTTDSNWLNLGQQLNSGL